MTEGIKLLNQEKIRKLGKVENYQYLGILKSDIIKNAEIKGKKKTSEQWGTTQDQTTRQNSYQRDKHLGSPPRKIIGTILRKDPRRTVKNGPKYKKTLMALQKTLHHRNDVDRLYVSRKEGGTHLRLRLCIDTLTRRLREKNAEEDWLQQPERTKQHKHQ